jgi:hypothetical protein
VEIIALNPTFDVSLAFKYALTRLREQKCPFNFPDCCAAVFSTLLRISLCKRTLV